LTRHAQTAPWLGVQGAVARDCRFAGGYRFALAGYPSRGPSNAAVTRSDPSRPNLGAAGRRRPRGAVRLLNDPWRSSRSPIDRVTSPDRYHHSSSGSRPVADRPPSTGTTAPVTKLALSESRKAITSATSSGRPTRPSGWMRAISRSMLALALTTMMPAGTAGAAPAPRRRGMEPRGRRRYRSLPPMARTYARDAVRRAAQADGGIKRPPATWRCRPRRPRGGGRGPAVGSRQPSPTPW
jgi:hypothetical protein